jgi:hypothetical protein
MPPSGRRVNHTIVVKQEEPVAVIDDVIVFPIKAVPSPIAAMGAGRGQEAEVATDGMGGAGEEFRVLVVVEVDEEAGELEREEVGAQAAAVHGIAPRPAHAAGGCEPARRDAAKDVSKHVVRQARRLVLHLLLLPPIVVSSRVCRASAGGPRRRPSPSRENTVRDRENLQFQNP